MIDTTNTTSTTAVAEIEEHKETPLRPAMIGVLARAEAAEQAALLEVARLKAENAALRAEQITDGADPRLERFWEKAGRIADAADFCSEYDRMADAMNGPAREREWEVELTIRVDITRTVTVNATDEEIALDRARDEIHASDFESDEYNVDDWEVIDSSAERS